MVTCWSVKGMPHDRMAFSNSISSNVPDPSVSYSWNTEPMIFVKSSFDIPRISSAASSASCTCFHAIVLLYCVLSSTLMIVATILVATSAMKASYSTPLGPFAASPTIIMIWKLVNPKSASRMPLAIFEGGKNPPPCVSYTWQQLMRKDVNSEASLDSSKIWCLMSSTIIAWNKGTNSSNETLPSSFASTSTIAVLISRLVRFKGRSRKNCWNSFKSSSPLPSLSAVLKASRIMNSSSSLLIPWKK
mmetsp:Transcript_38970/g.60718  ORF Transcript_38970/g.60718 Transcript_38970/m.60718 type:complete len:246 (+) Transcript_38970:338-1075(+)